MLLSLKTGPEKMSATPANIVWVSAVFCLLLTGLSACKGSSGSKKNKTVYYPATLTEEKEQTGVGQTTSRYTFTYDGQHRIISKTADFDPGMRSEYAYTDGGYTESLFVNDSLATLNTYTLNSLNLVDSLVQIDEQDHDTLSARYLYNSNKELIAEKQYFYTRGYGFLLITSIAYAYDTTRNLLTATDGYKVVSYSYSPDNVNSLSLGQIYMQQLPTLPDVVTTTQSTGEISSVGHIYTYDKSGHLITDALSQSDGTTIVRTYTY